MPKEYQPIDIFHISKDNPVPGHEAEVAKIRNKGADALAIVCHGGTARFQNMMGAILALYKLGLMPKNFDLQIATSAGSICEALMNAYDLSQEDNYRAMYETFRSMSGVIGPWLGLVSYSASGGGLALDLEKYSNEMLKGAHVRPDIRERMRDTLMLVTAGREGPAGHTPSLFSGNSLQTAPTEEIAIQRLFNAVRISSSMPPLIQGHKGADGIRYADGGLPGSSRRGHRDFPEKYEEHLAQAIMPSRSTVVVIDPLPTDPRIKKSGVFLEVDSQERNLIRIVPTSQSGVFGRKGPMQGLRFDPSRFDEGFETVMRAAPELAQILKAKGHLPA